MRGILAGGLWLLALGSSCAPSESRPRVLGLLDFHQAGERGVFLNETLVFHFSEALDRSSVTRQSLRVLDSRGRAVPGALEVAGSRVRFHPTLPSSPGLEDGGFLIGEAYKVELVGFPLPDGLRSLEGAPLAKSLRFDFLTVSPAASVDHRLFSPPLTEQVPYLRVASTHLGPVDPIRLELDQALDPRTVSDETFRLHDGAVALPLRVRLIENTPTQAAIELRLAGEGDSKLRALEPGSWYVLRLNDETDPPRTLGGIPVQPSWLGSQLAGARVSVFGSEIGRRRIDFEGEGDLWSPQPVPGADGAARWDGGSLGLRYPAAAGTGADGEVELSEILDSSRLRDLNASRLSLAGPARLELPMDGLVVLRSQGAMELGGALVRPPPASRPPSMEPEFRPGETLTDWLARMQALDPTWTVLIAGGDLVVSAGAHDAGGLLFGGPVLLVAGGRLRIGDSVQGTELWKLSPGDGGSLAQPGLQWVPGANDSDLPPGERFLVDAPLTNRLVEPLTFGVLSASFRPHSGVANWRPGTFEGDPGVGELRVRWLGQRFSRDGVEEFGPVDDVLLLQGSDALRFQVELTMPATAGPWRPPVLDHVEFRWDLPSPSAPDAR